MSPISEIPQKEDISEINAILKDSNKEKTFLYFSLFKVGLVGWVDS